MIKKVLAIILLLVLLLAVGMAEDRNLEIRIEIIKPPVIYEGDEIILYPILIGNWEGLTYTYQWEYSKDGIEYFPIPDATNECYVFYASKETLKLWYRLAITIPDELLQ